MATSFLKKIILEELQKVLKEEDTTEQTIGRCSAGQKEVGTNNDGSPICVDMTSSEKAARDLGRQAGKKLRKGIEAGKDFLGRLGPNQSTGPCPPGQEQTGEDIDGKPMCSPKKVVPKISKMKEAIINLQKQLRRLGATQGVSPGKIVPLRIDGILGPITGNALNDSRVQSIDSISSAIKSVGGIRELTKELSKMTPEQYENNRRITNREMAILFNKPKEDSSSAGVKTASDASMPGGREETPVKVNVGPSQEEIEQEKKAAEEKRKAEKAVYSLVPKKESLKRDLARMLKNL